MTKGSETRARILQQAAVLFNQKGYSGASLSDVMTATGLKKGGIYRHFETKEALAVEAFDFAVERMSAQFLHAIKDHKHSLARLAAIIRMYTELQGNPEIPGGCPVMNTAIDADDGNPLLREHARVAMDKLRAFVRRIVAKGQTRGEIRPELDPDELASVLLSGVEGALMMSRLYRDPIHLERTQQYLLRHLDQEVAAQ